MKARAHVTYWANGWVKELTKERHSIPRWTFSVVANIMKPHTNLEPIDRLSRDIDVVHWCVDEESFVGICKRLLIEPRREPQRDDKEALLVG